MAIEGDGSAVDHRTHIVSQRTDDLIGTDSKSRTAGDVDDGKAAGRVAIVGFEGAGGDIEDRPVDQTSGRRLSVRVPAPDLVIV